MVSYQKFVALVYQATPDEKIASLDENQELMSSIGHFWTENREELKTATVAEAKQVIQNHLEL